MRFTKEFKLECVRKYKAGEHIDDPGGCKHGTFTHSVRVWARMYDALGEEGLEHRMREWPWQDKMALVQRALGGESLTSVANASGIQACLLSKWLKTYREAGLDGLKSSMRKGRRPPRMRSKPKPPNGPKKTADELERENEELRAENEYLKKLSALVQGRKGRRPKRK